MSADPGFEPEAILRVLNDRGVTYVVVGGFAVAAHGVVRATADLDLVIERGWHNAGRLEEALKQLDARDATEADTPLTQEVLARRADRRLSTRHGELHLLRDVAGVPSYQELQPTREITLDDLVVPVAGLEALLRMKRAAGRPKDELDIEELEALHRPAPGD